MTVHFAANSQLELTYFCGLILYLVSGYLAPIMLPLRPPLFGKLTGGSEQGPCGFAGNHWASEQTCMREWGEPWQYGKADNI